MQFPETNQLFPDLGFTDDKIETLSVDKLITGTIRSQRITLAITDTRGDIYIAGGTFDAAAWTATNGFILGLDDSASNREKFYLGNATNWIDWNVTTADTLTIAGSLIAGEIHIPDRNTTTNSFHVNTTGNMWIGATETDFAANNANAEFYVLNTGVMRVGTSTNFFDFGVTAANSLTITTNTSSSTTSLAILSSDNVPAFMRHTNALLSAGAGLRIAASNDMAIDQGGQVTFMAVTTTGGSVDDICTIKGAKETGVSTNRDGYLTFGTRGLITGATTLSEKMRITSLGRVGVNQSNPSALVDIVYPTSGMTTGSGLSVTRNLASASTDSAVVSFIQDNSGDDQFVLNLQQDAAASGLRILGTISSNPGPSGLVNLTIQETRTIDRGPYITFTVPQTNPSTSEDMGVIGCFASDGVSGNRTAYFTFWTRDTALAERMRIEATGNIGINTSGITAQVAIDQSSTTGAKPVLYLDQADVSEEFVRFIGTSANAVLTQSIVENADVAVSTLQGWLKVFVNDAGGQLVVQSYYIPIYTLA